MTCFLYSFLVSIESIVRIPSFFDVVLWGHEHECKIGSYPFNVLFLVAKITMWQYGRDE